MAKLTADPAASPPAIRSKIGTSGEFRERERERERDREQTEKSRSVYDRWEES
jgi:hypothetical protein